MSPRRDDGLDRAFFPIDAVALVLAVVLTARTDVTGLWRLPVLVGWFLVSFLAVLAAVYFVFLLISLTVNMKKTAPEKDHPAARRIVHYVIGQLCRFARVRIRFEGGDMLPQERFLVVSNHRSAYDPISTVWALRKTPTAFVTKPENHRIPLAGPLIYRANFLSIDREDPRKAMTTISAAANLLKNDVVSVGIYPEGTRNRHPEEGLLPFHNGVFKIAQKANAPLVVMTVRGSENIRKNWPRKPTEITLRVCAVLPPEEIQGPTADVSRRVRDIMLRDLERA